MQLIQISQKANYALFYLLERDKVNSSRERIAIKLSTRASVHFEMNLFSFEAKKM